jgi:hypothetical protein
MRSRLFLLSGSIVAATLIGAAKNASATLVAYEPFNYTAGSFANNTASAATGTPTQTTPGGFTGNWTCGASGTIVSGLTYTSLPTTDKALQSGSARQFVSFANSLTRSGTEYISFLFGSGTGNGGGNANGVYLINGGTGLFFGFGFAPISGSTGGLGLGTTASAGSSALGATLLGSDDSFVGTYGTTYFVVIEIQYNTSGVSNDTVTVYINPVAGQSTPGVSATYTSTSFSVGTLSGMGLNVNGGGETITLDEVRVGTTYADVAGVSSGCTAPTAFTVGGGGAYCSGGSGVSVTLSGSQATSSGTNFIYFLLLGGNSTGTNWTGNGSALSTNVTAAGSYTILASNTTTGCTATMTSSATVTVNALPTQYSVGGGGAYCSGGSGVAVTLGNSQSGVTYYLQLGGNNTGTTLAGTGSSLSFNSVTAAGTYTILASNTTTGCTQSMTGNATVTVNALPTQYGVGGGGAYCSGGGVAVTLSNSQSGVTYYLQLGGSNTGTTLAGTGSSLSFNSVTAAGTYTILASNTTTGCTQSMTGNALVTTITLSPTSLPGGTGGVAYVSTTITASGGTSPYTFAVTSGSLPTGLSLSTGGVLSGTPTGAGAFPVIITATDSSGSHCVGSQSYTISILGGIIVEYDFTSSPTFSNYTTVAANIDGTGAGAGTNISVAGTVAISQFTSTPPPSTTSSSLKGLTGNSLDNNLTYSTNTANNEYFAFTVYPSTGYLLNLSGQSITLSNGQAGADQNTGWALETSVDGFSTVLFTTNLNSVSAGIWAPMTVTLPTSASWNNLTNITFRIYFFTDASGTADFFDHIAVRGSAVSICTQPATFNVSGGGAMCSAGSSQTITLSGSSNTATAYLLYNGATYTGITSNGTGSALTFTGITTPGAYTVLGSNTTTACTVFMNGSASVTAIALSPTMLSNGTANVAYPSTTITASGGTSPYTYSVTSGTLPTGLSLSSGGVLTGTPTAGGVFAFTVTATDHVGCVGTQSYTVTVIAPPSITTQPTAQSACSNSTTSFSVVAAGTTPLNYSWQVAPGSGWGTSTNWTFSQACSGSGGFFIGNSTNATGCPSGQETPGINSLSTTSSFGMASVGAALTASRNFSNLQVGQSVVFDFQNLYFSGAGANVSNVVSLSDSTGTTRFSFAIGNNNAGVSDTNYTIIDNANAADYTDNSGIPLTEAGLHLTFTLTATNTYNLTVYNLSNSVAYAFTGRTLGGTAGHLISQIAFTQNNNGGGSTCYRFYFNHVLIGNNFYDEAANYTIGGCEVGGTTTWTNAVSGGSVLATGADIVTGSATNATLQFSPALPADATNYDVVVSNPYGLVVSSNATLTIATVPTITTATPLNQGTAGTSYSQQISPSGAGFTYAVTSGGLPSGLSLSSGGLISGTPTVTGISNLTLTVTNSAGCTASSNFTLIVICGTITVAPASLANVDIGEPYSETASASGGFGPYTFAVTSGTLSNGLTLSSGGVLSGTYNGGTGTDTVTITATDAAGCTQPKVYALALVNCPLITLSPGSLPSGTAGTAYNQTISASGDGSSYTFTQHSGTLPTSLNLSSAGLLSGTPTAAGAFNFSVQATSPDGCSGVSNYTVNIVCPTITVSGTPPSGTVGTAYPGTTITASGGTSPYTFTAPAGAGIQFPQGLSLSSAGVITGTPNAAGTYAFVVQATDHDGCTGSNQFTVAITCPTITVSSSPASPPNGTLGTAYAGTTNSASGGTSPYAFGINSGSLPPGLTLTSSNGVIAGTPTIGGSFSFAVQATDADGCLGTSSTYNVSIACSAITLSPSTLSNAPTGAAYSQTISASGGGSYTFGVSSGTLPTGLGLVSSNGLLSGTATTVGNYSFTIQAVAGACTGSQAYAVTIFAVPAITNQPTSATVCSGTSTGFAVAVSGTTPLSYSWQETPGSGWGAGNGWIFSPSGCPGGAGGYFIGDSTAGSESGCAAPSTGIDSPGTTNAFAIGNVTAGGLSAARNFGALAVGQSISLDFQNRCLVNAGASMTNMVSLSDSTGTARFKFSIGNNGIGVSDTNYTIADANAVPNYSNNSGIPLTTAGLHLVFTLVTTDMYNLTVYNQGNQTLYSFSGRTLGGTTGHSISQIRFDANNNGGNQNYFFLYFNHILIGNDYYDDAANYSTGACGTTSWTNSVNNGQRLVTGADIAVGTATNATLQFSPAQSADATNYDVVVYSPYGLVRSSNATLTVNAVPTATVSGTTAICSNSTTTIQAALAGPSPWYITWSDGATQNGLTNSPATRTVSPISTTTYTVTVVSNANCTGSSSGSAVVTVNPLPTATVSGTTTVCPGNSANIQAALTGTGPWNITWLDGATNYTQNGVATSPAQRTVSPSSTTTYTVTSVSDANCTGTSSGSAVITVTASPSVTATSNAPYVQNPGQYEIVQGQTLQLSASSVSGAISYNWSRDGGATFTTGQTANDTPPSGTHTYTVTVPTACGTAVGSTPNIVVLTADASGVPDSWKTEHGYLASTSSSTVGANGFTLLQSYLAGLDPTNVASVLDMSSASVTPSGIMTVSWQSEQDGTTPTRLYDFYSLTAPYTNGASWSRIYSNIAPAGATTSTNDDAAGMSQRFYRVTIAGHTDDVATIGIAGVQMLTLQPGANYISMSTTQATPTLLSVLGTNLPRGSMESTATTVDIWDQNSQAFLVNNARYWLDTGASGWIQHNTALPSNNVQLDPTKGFVVTIPGQGSQTLYVPGFVLTVAESQTVQSNGYTVASSTYPQSVTLGGSGLSNSVTGGTSLNRSDNLLFFDPATQLFDIRAWYYTGNDTWLDENAVTITNQIQLEPGTAFLIQRRARSTNLIWTNPVPYQVPLQGP